MTLTVLARQWWQQYPNDPRLRFGMAVVADSVKSLARNLDVLSMQKHEQLASATAPFRLAFVYPGLGNQFAGMGRGLSALWPGVLELQDSETDFLKEQLDPRVWWNGELPRSFDDHRSPILGSVSVGARDGRAPRSRCLSRRRDRLQFGRIRGARRAESLDRPR